ncbi:MAG TPA: YkgJ family cysteine cluster protein [Vicinamibacterales bacterium]
MRIDPQQRFACSQCGRCCRGFDVVVTAAELDLYGRLRVAEWFKESDGARDPFEPVPGAPALQRIRKRDDGACVFLSAGNRCRIHEELGPANKPLTCRMFPYSFHAAADGVVLKASFNCPTIAANEGRLISESRVELEALKKEWAANGTPRPAALELVEGRTMDTRSLYLLRTNLIALLQRDPHDVRAGVRRIAAVLDDLTRSRVLALSDQDFAEYLSLTVPHAATKPDPPPAKPPGAIARMMQYGFLYAVAAVRSGIANPNQSRMTLRMRRLQLLAHFHGLAPSLEGINVKALKEHRADINAPEIRAIVFHYLRSTLETLGATGRPIVDEIALGISYLNAAVALATIKAHEAGRPPDRAIFIEALTDASDVSHARNGVLDWILTRFGGSPEALWHLARPL